MSERLNIVFCDETSGAPYALLAMRDATLETPSHQHWMKVLGEVVKEYSLDDNASISRLAAQMVGAFVSESESIDLLPGDSAWLADLTVSIRRVDGEFHVACKKRDFSALGIEFDDDELDSLDAFDGFDGTADEFVELVEGVNWGS